MQTNNSIKGAGNCLRAFRTVYDLTHKDMALAGISQSANSERENDKRSLTEETAAKYDDLYQLKPGTVYAAAKIMKDQSFQECLRFTLDVYRMEHKSVKKKGAKKNG